MYHALHYLRYRYSTDNYLSIYSVHVYSILFISLCKQSEADQPLLTRSMIQERLESKYAKYQQVVVRVQFPDKVVLQGLFRPKETGQ